ncbi:MarR family winged helix-turn-helix transcriptional regulator [Limosilactobacillus viscerum]|uniref:MarR family winged helix-turn-helix transcriptional regulator n=1 Tax=Limosilactobacillus viscerum TaxID=2993450 RepID=UPI0024B8BC02|nr:MarR family transcriptional regulator [Limosilactobacillus viscerum]
MVTADDRLFQQLFCLIAEIHHVALKRPANKASFRGQGRLIHLLAHNTGVSQRELATLAQVKPGSISEVLERLEKNKIVERWRDETDRRIVRVKLTAKGKELYQENLATRQQFERELLQKVTAEERKSFLNVVQKMQKQLKANYGDLLPQEWRGV